MIKWTLLLLALGQTAFSATFYVSTTGSHQSPFSSIAHAATNIQSAVNSATNTGDLVLIDDGIYVLSTAITINNAITVKGINGPVSAIVDGNGATRCFELTGVASFIEGLTITNGTVAAGDGGGINSGSSTIPIVTNCWIQGNSAEYGGGVLGATIWNSVISGNSALFQGGGVNGSKVYNSLIIGNSILAGGDYGGGAEACELYNCTVVGNIAPDTGGADSCDIYNSVIYSNVAPNNPDAAYCTMFSSCSREGLELSGSYITNAPLFIEPLLGNYRLQNGSPCKNTGDNSYVSWPGDLDGNARIVGGLVDMGAYEVQASPSDLDGDGMPDTWEVDYFGSTNALPGAHSDSDMFTNLEEYIAGTDPTNSASYFAVTNGIDSPFILTWYSAAGREYQVFWTDHLTNAFQSQLPIIDSRKTAIRIRRMPPKPRVSIKCAFKSNSYTLRVLRASARN